MVFYANPVFLTVFLYLCSMSKQVYIITFFAFLSLFFASCQPDPATEEWMDNTGWEARLEGLSYVDESGRTVMISEEENWMGSKGGWIGFLIHTGTGYYLAYQFISENVVKMGRGEKEYPMEYDYPVIRLPYDYYFEDGSSEKRYNTGTISEDYKSIFFEKFVMSSYYREASQLYLETFTNLTFSRVHGLPKN